MATRFYFSETQPAPVTPPAPGAEWELINGVTGKLLTGPDGSLLTTTAYTPDAENFASKDALHRQYVSDPLVAQTIGVQGITAQFQGLEQNAANHMFLTLAVKVISNDGTTVRSTILAITRDTTNELATTSTNRNFPSTNTTSYTCVDGDRLLIEVGVGGTPTTTGGTQGHNASLRFGCAGTADLPANDTDTSATTRPWLEFAGTLIFDVSEEFASWQVPVLTTTALTALLFVSGIGPAIPPAEEVAGVPDESYWWTPQAVAAPAPPVRALPPWMGEQPGPAAAGPTVVEGELQSAGVATTSFDGMNAATTIVEEPAWLPPVLSSQTQLILRWGHQGQSDPVYVPPAIGLPTDEVGWRPPVVVPGPEPVWLVVGYEAIPPPPTGPPEVGADSDARPIRPSLQPKPVLPMPWGWPTDDLPAPNRLGDDGGWPPTWITQRLGERPVSAWATDDRFFEAAHGPGTGGAAGLTQSRTRLSPQATPTQMYGPMQVRGSAPVALGGDLSSAGAGSTSFLSGTTSGATTTLAGVAALTGLSEAIYPDQTRLTPAALPGQPWGRMSPRSPAPVILESAATLAGSASLDFQSAVSQVMHEAALPLTGDIMLPFVITAPLAPAETLPLTPDNLTWVLHTGVLESPFQSAGTGTLAALSAPHSAIGAQLQTAGTGALTGVSGKVLAANATITGTGALTAGSASRNLATASLPGHGVAAFLGDTVGGGSQLVALGTGAATWLGAQRAGAVSQAAGTSAIVWTASSTAGVVATSGGTSTASWYPVTVDVVPPWTLPRITLEIKGRIPRAQLTIVTREARERLGPREEPDV